jgi:hypothetical protein
MYGPFLQENYLPTIRMEEVEPRGLPAPLTSVLHKPVTSSALLWGKSSSSNFSAPCNLSHKKVTLPSLQTLPRLTSLLMKHANNSPCIGGTHKRQREFNDSGVSNYSHVDEKSWKSHKRRRKSSVVYSILPQNDDNYEYTFERSTTRSQQPLSLKKRNLTTSSVMVNFPEPLSSPTSVSNGSIRPSGSKKLCSSAVPFMEEYSPTQKGNFARLLLQSKEFLQSTQLIRNSNNNIDWIATFLKIGFSGNSIFSRMCPLRKGRWKAEEEVYTMELLRCLERGELLLAHGESIRTFIAKKLHSDDMRVLKKLSNCKAFHFARGIHPRMSDENEYDFSQATIDATINKLDSLKAEFLRSVQLEAFFAVQKYLNKNSIH